MSPGRVTITCLLAALAVASVSLSASSSPTRERADLLPNLVPRAPYEIVLEDDGSGCNAYETVSEGAKRCLRYDTIVTNLGAGPLELRYRIDQLGRDQQVRQRMYRSDGTFTERQADTYEFHPMHSHFHYANFAVARLWSADTQGRRLGRQPVRESDKAGFCLYDGENLWKGRSDSQPRRYRYPAACLPTEVTGGELSQVNGLSPGWMDIYGYELSDQYIDVYGLPPGRYVLEIELDPLDTLEEADEQDNRVSVLIHISKGEARRLGSTR